MDIDFWASRVQSAKHFSARLHHSSDNTLTVDDPEGNDESRACFLCPFCYVDIEVPVLCRHLEEEHCFDFKNAVCPLCAANLGKDPIGHFTMQHAQSVKRKRKSSNKSGFWGNTSTLLGKDLHELSSFLGSVSVSGKGNVSDQTPDPLLSFCNIPHVDSKSDQHDQSSSSLASPDMGRHKQAEKDGVEQHDYEERKQRAEFFQELILSTIF
ncbi:protein DEHYDRATION-INDUCED 19 homolog 6-like [Impatiens glandulifera]|uniref:protein DEHYDRATION-INDUCED 19 homolog 6-like n=1 Tax=Impatiens glandulifera TaxID=253017 RepID=UPI001FB16C9C|nr:protein DEHYDRATION-INDUCED 19 homolog 6-like [Impatiens glandulifera]